MDNLVSPDALDSLVEDIEGEAVEDDSGPLVCTVGKGFDYEGWASCLVLWHHDRSNEDIFRG
jgi:hypothetical protein